MKSRYREEAEAEAAEAIDYYEAKGAGLGHRFARLLLEAIDEIENRPRSFPRVEGRHVLGRSATGSCHAFRT